MLPPLLENDILFIRDNGNKVIKPTRAKATLYTDHIEVNDENGNTLLNTPLSSMVATKYNATGINNSRIVLSVNGQKYLLNFLTTNPILLSMFLGIIGLWFYSKWGSSHKIAESWALTMGKNGVKF
jgi:hypothetical protein